MFVGEGDRAPHHGLIACILASRPYLPHLNVLVGLALWYVLLWCTRVLVCTLCYFVVHMLVCKHVSVLYKCWL